MTHRLSMRAPSSLITGSIYSIKHGGEEEQGHAASCLSKRKSRHFAGGGRFQLKEAWKRVGISSIMKKCSHHLQSPASCVPSAGVWTCGGSPCSSISPALHRLRGHVCGDGGRATVRAVPSGDGAFHEVFASRGRLPWCAAFCRQAGIMRIMRRCSAVVPSARRISKSASSPGRRRPLAGMAQQAAAGRTAWRIRRAPMSALAGAPAAHEHG